MSASLSRGSVVVAVLASLSLVTMGACSRTGQYAATGGAIGAAGGALVGAASGNAVEGAVIGGVGGAAVGAVVAQ